jgi:hypothetical protein
MEINWQNVFYITTSFAMVAAFVVFIWLIWLLFIVSKLTNNFAIAVQRLGNIPDDIRLFEKEIILKVSRFLLQILKKGGK